LKLFFYGLELGVWREMIAEDHALPRVWVVQMAY
jgi:hypothetical protein